MYIGVHVKYLLFLSSFNETRIFSTDFCKISNFMKISLVGAEFYADGQTDMMKLIGALHNFADSPENSVAV